MKMKVGVIGPFFNAEHHVKRWLECFANQSYQDFHLYLVDDGSTDSTKERLETTIRERALPASLLTTPYNLGPSAARNIAIKRALQENSKLILLLDSDCLVNSEWVLDHWEFHSRHPQIKVMGGAIAGISHSAIGKADGICSWFTAIPFSKSGWIKNLHLSSTNMSIKAEVFNSVGFFDEKLKTGEDVDFCRRLQKAGIYPWLESDLIVHHVDRDSVKQAREHHYRWGLHSYTLSLRDHGGYFKWLTKVSSPRLVTLAIPAIAMMTSGLMLLLYSKTFPKVWLYIPWILYLKWWNALGVYHGYKNPSLCIRQTTNERLVSPTDPPAKVFITKILIFCTTSWTQIPHIS